MIRGDTSIGAIYARLTRACGLYVFGPLLLILSIPVFLNIPISPDFGFSVRHRAVIAITPGGPAAVVGVQPGDLILSVNNRPTRTMSEYYAACADNSKLLPVTYLVKRGATAQRFVVQPVPPSSEHKIVDYSQWLAGLGFLIIGWYTFFQRHDPLTRSFFAVCLLFAFFLMDIPDLPSVAYISAKELVRALLQLLMPVFFLRFMLHFPSPMLPVVKRFEHSYLLFIPVLPLFLPSLYAEVNRLDPAGWPLLTTTEIVTSLYVATYFLAGLVIFARKALRRDRPIQQSKLRVVLLGMIFGLVPFMGSALLGSLMPDSSLNLLRWMGLSVVLVPLTFGVAILRYGALDASFVIRCGLNYGVLTFGLLAAYILVVGWLGSFLSRIFGVSASPMAMLAMAGSALVVLPLRRTLQGWIERTFYPALRADRAAIENLGRELTGLIDGRNTTVTLLSRLAALYQPRTLSLFLLDTRDNLLLRERMRFVEGRRARSTGGLSPSSTLAEYLDQMRRPVFVEEYDDLGLALPRDAESTAFLEERGIDLFVPLIVSNGLSGFLAFGPKSLGGLYTQADLANLRGLAVQAAALLESQRLYQKVLDRKQVETELKVASNIQARLLPTESFVGTSLEICGRMEPCRHVGGDYFDYFRLDDDTVGLAIADVSGKGIPAALLMADLRASLRTAAAELRQPEAVVQYLNRTCGCSMPNENFISFFYATCSLDTRVLSYCNAGMDPPLLFRHNLSYYEKLRKGGPVLGALEEHNYRRGTLALEDGDLIVYYTDGLTEQQNDVNEFFDLDRLIQTIRTSPQHTLADVQEDVFKAVTDFGGSRRTDDRTLMLMRALKAKAASSTT